MIFFIISPLNIPYALFSVIIHASYWDNILKILYGEARPYWVFRDLEPSCNGGFGNPSGHSMSSSAVYLSLWHIFSNYEYFEKSYLKKFLLFIYFSLIIFLVIFSRLVLAAHTINQVLFGYLLGISVYLFHFYVFQIDKLSSRDFFELFRSKRKRVFFIIFYSSLFLISLIFYFAIQNTQVIEDNNDYIKKNCERIEDYRKFNEDGLFNSLAIFGMIGAHIGLSLFTYYLEQKNLFDKYEEIYNFNKTNCKNKVIILFGLLLSGIPIIFFFVLPGRMDLILVYIFKIIVPYLLGTIGIFGLGLWFVINQRYCNEKIYENTSRDELNLRISI